ncbi:hypothetical protein BpHYR1_048542 [Brachionus plicatilis]|uniref:Uncharacterized protein n=1 Tax=Brachionus plicatilis TaxID=10195 RepID=A0A3M7QKN6_BRAPC|nr:hypothetical protein BpHYR1_048542 [Brachionus plicatilis]
MNFQVCVASNLRNSANLIEPMEKTNSVNIESLNKKKAYYLKFYAEKHINCTFLKNLKPRVNVVYINSYGSHSRYILKT